MARAAKRTIFGIHSITFYSRLTGLPYGQLDVLGNGTFEMSGETVKLKGGSNKFDWAVESGNIESSINLTVKEYPDFLMELFLGKAPTPISADTTGATSVLTNKKGSSIVDVTNGISVVAPTAGDETDLKFGKYVIKATDVDEISIYGLTNVDFNNGNDTDYLGDDLSLVVTQAIVAGANAIAALGITFTGVGTPDFTVGDTATFEVLPIHTGASEVIIGGLTDIFPAFGALIVTQRSAAGEMFEIDCPNCTGSGLNLGGAEKAFTETPLTAAVAYDSTLGGIAKIRTCKAAA